MDSRRIAIETVIRFPRLTCVTRFAMINLFILWFLLPATWFQLQLLWAERWAAKNIQADNRKAGKRRPGDVVAGVAGAGKVQSLRPHPRRSDAVQSERDAPTGEKVKTFAAFATNY